MRKGKKIMFVLEENMVLCLLFEMKFHIVYIYILQQYETQPRLKEKNRREI